MRGKFWFVEMLVLLNIPLRRDAPALPEGEPFYRERLQPKPLTPGEVAAEGRRRGVSEGNRGGCRKADGEGFPKEIGVAAERQRERVLI